jgi:hypothetical protein
MSETDKQPLDTAALLADLAAWWADPPRLRYTGNPASRIAGSQWDQEIPEGTSNPYWEVIRQLPLDDMPAMFGGYRPEPTTHVFTDDAKGIRYFADRFALCGTYSWSICSPGDIAWLKDVLGGRGVVETGAGTGYWAWQMEQAGISVAAYDPIEPAPGNHFAKRSWATVLRDDHSAAKHHPDRALFLCWPSYSDPWAAQALASYTGDMLIYAGEGEGGCCADDEFFTLRDAEFEEIGDSPKHISYWGIHCYLTAYRRKA